ncbi:MAG: hypothetical protein IJ297_05935 [Clostridia bacterium]|nr:hypothetical protein [Clostridia bacterium]
MDKDIVIAINMECADVFIDFAKENPDFILPVEHKSFVGSNEIMEFIITVTPHALTALASYLIARTQLLKKEIKLKKGDIEIEIKNADITPETALQLLEKLEQQTHNNE